jgi:hypothetical protein
VLDRLSFGFQEGAAPLRLLRILFRIICWKDFTWIWSSRRRLPFRGGSAASVDIDFVCDGHDVRKQPAKFHTVRIFVQCRKNADLQDSRLIYDISNGVALFLSQISVVTCGD